MSHKILIVDDEAAIRMSVAEALAADGFATETALVHALWWRWVKSARSSR